MPKTSQVRADYNAVSHHNVPPLTRTRSALFGAPRGKRHLRRFLLLGGATVALTAVMLSVVPKSLSENRVARNPEAKLAKIEIPLELPSQAIAGENQGTDTIAALADEPSPARGDTPDAPEPVAQPVVQQADITPAVAVEEPRTEEGPDTGAPTSVTEELPQEPGGIAEESREEPGDGLVQRSLTVRPGDSLYVLFEKNGLSANSLAQIIDSPDYGKQLKRLHPGQTIELYIGADNELRRLVYHRSKTESIRYERNERGYAGVAVETPLEPRLATASGSIEDSLYLAGRDAGVSDRVIMELAEIYGWDIDFALDIRSGDKFTVIYEELYKDGDKVRDGAILAAEFVNRGRSIRALRYTDDSGQTSYFTPEGKSMRKAFLRSPLNFTRISSPFNLRRKHPVLHTIRAHKGVDYAAPRGTPVKASGNGTVSFVGRKGGYGKAVILRHGSIYTTVYAHLSRYAKGVRSGRRVQQGQVIGYVGSTGLATGPHLHYEFRVRGVHKNPLKVKLPEAEPIDKRYLDDFLDKTRPMMVRLDTLSSTQLAASSQ